MNAARSPAIQFFRNPYRKEWAIQCNNNCIGHIWYWPLGRCYCLRILNRQTAYYPIFGKAREAATDLVALAYPEFTSSTRESTSERRAA